jgi:subtilase family serine protease
MRRRSRLTVATAVASLPLLGISGQAAAAPTPSTALPHATLAAAAIAHSAHSCAAEAPGTASCTALVRTDTTPKTAADLATPDSVRAGYGPADLQSAYHLPSSTRGAGQTVAIVAAYDDPTAEADLSVYRAQFGIAACTSASGCFSKVNQTGGTATPKADPGWAQEISVDLDMVSAVCPSCHILLVEASSASFANLGAAENEAAALHAIAISNSYGAPDVSDATYGHFYNHPGIAITASSEGDGFGSVEYPASSHYVTAVGGSTLTRSATGAWIQTAWNGSSGGCSSLNTALTGQAGFDTGCTRRAVADVAAIADPTVGVAVYDSTPAGGQSGWLVFGGTSVGAPIIAGVYALAGNTATIDNNYPYTHYKALTDITTGGPGGCTPVQWCTARVGWDGPTGLGTPNGVGAF